MANVLVFGVVLISRMQDLLRVKDRLDALMIWKRDGFRNPRFERRVQIQELGKVNE